MCVCVCVCRLALASLNKHTEAVVYYRKALELDPDNDTYQANLKIAEQKMDTPSPVILLLPPLLLPPMPRCVYHVCVSVCVPDGGRGRGGPGGPPQ